MQFTKLNTFDLIAIDGDETKKFLQGQVTCDIDRLSPNHSLEGAICNIKGRVIADFRLLEFSGTCYLQMTKGMAEIVKPVLDKYMVFSKAESRFAHDEIERIGVVDDENSSTLLSLFSQLPESDGDVVTAGTALLIKIPGLVPRYEVWQFKEHVSAIGGLQEKLEADSEQLSDELWHLEDIRAGIVHITPSLSELHLPEALNYDISGVISFTKGCYTGQEIVARMFYRGTAKKRLFSGYCPASTQPPDSIDCLAAGSQSAVPGEILTRARDKQGLWSILAILPAAANEPGTSVYLNGDPQLPVEMLSLPYVAD